MFKKLSIVTFLLIAAVQVNAQTVDRSFTFSDPLLIGTETEDTQFFATDPTTTVTISVTNSNPTVTYDCTATVQSVDNLTHTQVQSASASNSVPPNSTVVVATVPIVGGVSGYSHASNNGASDTLSCAAQSSGGSGGGGTGGGGQVAGGTAGSSGSSGNAQFNGTVFLNAVDWTHDTLDISVGGVINNTTNVTSGTLEIELWFTSAPYSGGALTGYKVTSFRLPASCTTGDAQLAPGYSCISIDSGTIAASPPPAGTYYAVLALSEYNSNMCASNGGYCLDQAYTLLPNQQTVPATTGQGAGSGGSGGSSDTTGNAQFTGTVTVGGIDWTNKTVDISVAGVANTSASTTTGSLEIELWFTSAPYSGGPISGYNVASFRLPASCTVGDAQLAPASSCTAITSGTVSVATPPAGTYYAVLALEEYNSSTCPSNNGFCLDQGLALATQETVPSSVSSGGGGGGSRSGGGGSLGWLDIVALTFAIAVRLRATVRPLAYK